MRRPEMQGQDRSFVVSSDTPTDTVTSEIFFQGFQIENIEGFQIDNVELKKAISAEKPENRKILIDTISNRIAHKSTHQQNIFQDYLKLNHYTDDIGENQGSFLENSQHNRETSLHEKNINDTIN